MQSELMHGESDSTLGCAVVGPYVVSQKIAAGGMATVHLGRLYGADDARTVAVKRLRTELASQPEFVTMFLDEAKLAMRIRHPNVVETLDVVESAGEHLIVMEYVHGESLTYFLRALRKHETPMPLSIVGHVIGGMLRGLHAAHEVADDEGKPLGLIHRDVSPHNVLLSTDGRPMLLDFGVAKAQGRAHQTRQGMIKGKLQYMSPEQITGRPLDRRTDLFSAGIVLWEMLVGRPLFEAADDAAILDRLLRRPIESPAELVSGLPPSVVALVERALQRDPADRFNTAAQMADAMEGAFPRIDTTAFGRWVGEFAGRRLEKRARQREQVERAASQVRARPHLAGRFDDLVDDAAGAPPASASGSAEAPSGARARAQADPSLPELPDLLPPTPAAPHQPPGPAAGKTEAMGVDISPLLRQQAAGSKTVPLDPSQIEGILQAHRRKLAGEPAEPPSLELAPLPPPSGTQAPWGQLTPDVISHIRSVPPEPPSPHAAAAPQSPTAPVPPATAPPATHFEVDAPAMVSRRLIGRPRSMALDEPVPLRRRLALPLKLLFAAIAISVCDVLITRYTGEVLALGPVRPSLVAGLLASVAVLLGAWAAASAPRQ